MTDHITQAQADRVVARLVAWINAQDDPALRHSRVGEFGAQWFGGPRTAGGFAVPTMSIVVSPATTIGVHHLSPRIQVHGDLRGRGVELLAVVLAALRNDG